MHKRFLFGLIALVALVFSLNSVGLHAQRGRGQGRGRPEGAGQPAPNPHKPSKHDDGSADHPSRGQRPTTSQLATRNPQLAAKLQTLLPGANLESAGAGFRNLGQFVAAAHVSHNLGIPFDQLKDRVTGANATSLGQAIHQLKPGANADVEAKKASLSAYSDINLSQCTKPSS